MSENCACVSHDATDCAWIRDGRPSRDDPHNFPRKCECVCHDEDRDDYEEYDHVKP